MSEFLQFVLNLLKHSHVLKVSHIFTLGMWNELDMHCLPFCLFAFLFLMNRDTEAQLVGQIHSLDCTVI